MVTDDKLLFHYTSAQGLLGLLGPRTGPAHLWMTQVHYMNDTAEARHAYELTALELRRLESQCQGIVKAAAGVLGILHEGQEWQPPSGFARARDCSFSLSEDGDLLSQWRGYTPLGGYSLGYRIKDLKAFAAAQGLQLLQCVYEPKQQQEIVSTALLEIEAALKRGEVESLGLEGVSPERQVSVTANIRFQKLGHRLARTFKHSSFKEELEWRLLANIGVNDPRARWRVRGNLVVPYAELDVGLDSITPLRPSKIIVGPGVDYEQAAAAIYGMCPEHPPELVVTQSRSTLRG